MEKIETELRIQNRSNRTINMYIFFNEKFIDFINKKVNEVNGDDVKKFFAYLISKKNYSASSINLVRSALSFFYDFILKNNIVKEIKAPKITRDLPEIVTKEEIKLMLNNCGKLRDKLLISLMYASGLRVSECTNLKWSNLDLEDKTGLLKRG